MKRRVLIVSIAMALILCLAFAVGCTNSGATGTWYSSAGAELKVTATTYELKNAAGSNTSKGNVEKLNDARYRFSGGSISDTATVSSDGKRLTFSKGASYSRTKPTNSGGSTMNYSSVNTATTAAAVFSLIISILIGVACLVACLLLINKLISLIKGKGHYTTGAGILWFIGIFATPIALGIYALALPDKSGLQPSAPFVGGPAGIGGSAPAATPPATSFAPPASVAQPVATPVVTPINTGGSPAAAPAVAPAAAPAVAPASAQIAQPAVAPDNSDSQAPPASS